MLTFSSFLACTSPPEDVPVPVPVPSVSVGPEGGVFQLDEVEIDVPAGALASLVEIRIYETEDDPPAGDYEWLSRLWAAEPSGLVFDVPIRVRLPYAPSDAGYPAMYWSNDVGGYDRLEGEVTPGFVTAEISHFSGGFVATPDTQTFEVASVEPPLDLLFDARGTVDARDGLFRCAPGPR
jgi:hypothetical protein